jgi:hypothetical protein
MSDTIQSGMDCANCSDVETNACRRCDGVGRKRDKLPSAEELISNIRDCDYMEGDWLLTINDAIKAIESRDAAIRADEARKQAERYAACIDLAEQVKQWAEAYPTDIFHEPTPKECQTAFEKAGFTMDCFSAMVLRAFTKRWGREATKALADLEAPK